MKLPQVRSLRALQFLMAGSVALPLVLFIYASWINYRSAFAAADERIERSLAISKENALSLFRSTDLLLTTINRFIGSYEDAEIEKDEAGYHALLGELAATLPQIHSAWVFSGDGRPLASSNLFPVPKSFANTDRDYFRAQIERDVGMFIGAVVPPKVAGEPIFSASRRRPGEAFRGVIAVALRPDDIQRFYEAAGAAPGSYFALLRNDGSFLARHPLPIALNLRLDENSATRKAINQAPDFGILSLTSQTDGVDRRIGYQRVDGFPIYVLAGVDRQSVVKDWLALMGSHLIFGLPATAVMFGAMYVVFRRTRRMYEETSRREEAEVALIRAQEAEILDQRDSARSELGRATALFEAVINMTPDLVYVKDLDSRALLRNPAARFGKSWEEIKGLEESEWHQNSAEAKQVVANDRKVIEAGISMQFEEHFTTDKGPRILLSTKSPLRDESGKIVGIIGVSTDITDREEKARHVGFIMRELSHRSKNLLAIVQSIARQSVRQSISLPEFEERFNARLAALASVHDLLVREDWHGASLSEIVRAQVAPFAGPRLAIEGPEILVKPSVAQVLSMAFHELCTNACKYGALSNASGTVSVRWNIDSNPEQFSLEWSEHEGPCVNPPARSGFGTVVLERTALQILEAKVQLDFLPTGVVWKLTAPLAKLVDPPISQAPVL